SRSPTRATPGSAAARICTSSCNATTADGSYPCRSSSPVPRGRRSSRSAATARSPTENWCQAPFLENWCQAPFFRRSGSDAFLGQIELGGERLDRRDRREARRAAAHIRDEAAWAAGARRE